MKREDIEFLKEIQEKMKSNDEDEFYIIAEKKRIEAPRLFDGEGVLIYGSCEERVYGEDDIKELYNDLTERFEELNLKLEDGEIKFVAEESYGLQKYSIDFDDYVENIEFNLNKLNDLLGSHEYDCYEYYVDTVFSPNRIFLAKVDAERYIEKYKKYLTNPFVVSTYLVDANLRKVQKIIKETAWSKLEEENE